MSDQSENDEKPEAESRFEFGKSSRRTFLSRLGMASLIASAGPITPAFGERPPGYRSVFEGYHRLAVCCAPPRGHARKALRPEPVRLPLKFCQLCASSSTKGKFGRAGMIGLI